MKYRISVTRIEIESNKLIGACVYLWWSYKYSHIVHTLLASARFLDHISVLIKAWFLDHWLFPSRCSINLFQITSATDMLLRVGTCDVVRISPSLLWIDISNLILRSVLPHITDTCSHPTYSHISTPTWLPLNTTYVCSLTHIDPSPVPISQTFSTEVFSSPSRSQTANITMSTLLRCNCNLVISNVIIRIFAHAIAITSGISSPGYWRRVR